MSELKKLVTDIIADGVVDAAEVVQLETLLLADGVIDREEADALFEINDAVSGNANDASYDDFFVKAIASHILEDEETPGVIDIAEGDWLASKIEGDGTIDALEQRLLIHLETESQSIESVRLNDLIESSKTGV